MDFKGELLSALFWAILTSLFIWGGFMILLAYIYYFITDKIGIKHKGDDIWWDDNTFDLNKPKKTFKNMPIPLKIIFFLWLIGLANQINYEFTRNEIWIRLIENLS